MAQARFRGLESLVADAHLLHQGVEARRDARENRRRHLGPVGIAMQLLIRCLADPASRGTGIGDQRIGQVGGQAEVGEGGGIGTNADIAMPQ